MENPKIAFKEIITDDSAFNYKVRCSKLRRRRRPRPGRRLGGRPAHDGPIRRRAFPERRGAHFARRWLVASMHHDVPDAGSRDQCHDDGEAAPPEERHAVGRRVPTARGNGLIGTERVDQFGALLGRGPVPRKTEFKPKRHPHWYRHLDSNAHPLTPICNTHVYNRS